MRVWAELYDSAGNKTGTGPITAIKSASVSQVLDGAGSFSLDLAMDERVITTLAVDTEVRVLVQDEDNAPATEWVRGLIRDHSLQDEEGGTRITVSGPDTMDELTEITVGIGRSFQNQTMATIFNTLVGSAGWLVSMESAVAAQLQTARFDGVHVLRAITRCAEEKGIHLRNGTTASIIEVGEFGTLATTATGETVRAIKPPSVITDEIRANKAVMLIDRISRKTNSNDLVNWCIPIGAGEGSAALTLKDTTFAIYNENNTLWRAGTATRYRIYRRVNANLVTEFYIDARASTSVRMRQALVAFKEIGAVANSTAAKQQAANALAIAAMAYLDRQKVALITYKLSAKNVRSTIRPGDKIQVQYAGRIEIMDETRSTQPRLTYIDVNEAFWVMKVTKKISDGSITHDFDVATVDRYEMDTSRIIVTMMEAVQARNVSVGTQPYNFDNTWQDSIDNSKPALFPFIVNSLVTELPVVIVHWKTLPLWTPVTYFDLTPPEFNWQIRQGYNYPNDVRMFVNGVDVTSIYGPSGNSWNLGGTNAPLDVTCDISALVEAAPDLYQTHTIQFTCGTRIGPVEVYAPPRSNGGASTGLVELSITAQGHSRGV